MTDDSDLTRLYSARILGLATAMPRTGRLAAPDASVRRRAPACGSTITVDLVMQDGRIADFAQEVRACALGQAAASVLGAAVVGLDEATVRRGRDQLHAMLTSGGPVPEAPFAALAALEPAREYRNRHGSIMLAFEATLEAMEAARATHPS
ncbi:MAG: iron-sulfur cluster assembly scaffold protein [Limimaricola sp.]|uniref:iron-sulfur cluster assembly scaffold protein n=1 Tax=Limimaricola sp. TaxID=2211665 RepID=UPI001D7F9DB8|nr:iron-sulfur cluster assembly scaffold protein [Limimaricola sp.]MBI1418025.1 iron-sulfur cluster assembly scaffold protein [Limimaricola sp.]